jgi:methylated-DNA-[protein]-cysteine S-methyltransferase
MSEVHSLLAKLEKSYELGTYMNLSAFQKQVYLLTLCIPPGYVTTYGAIANILNSGPRNVGSALRKNPFTGYVEDKGDLPKVPCHRVVSSSGIGGFFGSTEGELIDRKIKLLLSEGVNIVKGKVNKSQVLTADQLLEKLIQH